MVRLVCYLSFCLNPYLFGNDLLFQILCLFTDNLRFQATGEVVILIYIFRIKTLKCVITWLISISMTFVEVNFSSLKNQNLMPSLLTSHPLCALQVSFLYFYQCLFRKTKDNLLYARAKKKGQPKRKTRINMLNLEEQQGHNHLNYLITYTTDEFRAGPKRGLSSLRDT